MAKLRYKIIMELNFVTFWDKVNEAINEGWEPLGGATKVVEEPIRVIDTTPYETDVNDDDQTKWLQVENLNRLQSQHMEWMQAVWLPPEKKTSWWRK